MYVAVPVSAIVTDIFFLCQPVEDVGQFFVLHASHTYTESFPFVSFPDLSIVFKKRRKKKTTRSRILQEYIYISFLFFVESSLNCYQL